MGRTAGRAEREYEVRGRGKGKVWKGQMGREEIRKAVQAADGARNQR